jgi:uncharacterized protein YggE
MRSRFLLVSLLALTFATPALAQERAKPDDTVSLDLSAEDWVTTKTAHVILDVEAAVNAASAGTVRADMTKAVNDAAKADWRLTGFTRAQDQTGMERWSVTFDTRLPEPSLGGLADAVKKASKAGMQISVGDIDFTPTLEETEAAKAALRTHILKLASDQLATLNATLSGRAYRIAQISFDADSTPPLPRMMRKPMLLQASAAMASAPDSGAAQERSQKLALTAHVTYAALPPVAAH